MLRYLLLLITLLCFFCTPRKENESVTTAGMAADSTVVTLISDDTVVTNDVVVAIANPSAPKLNKFPLSPKITPSLKISLSLDSLLNAENKIAFRAVIDNRRDTTLHLPEGTILNIPAMAFKNGSGDIDKVELVVKEFYTLSDIVFANLTTTTKDGMLETAGMIHISASMRGEECDIDDTKEIEISFPVRGDKQDGMQLFSGKRDAVQRMIWTPQDLIDLTTESTVYTVAESMPVFPGGYESLYTYIRKNLKYPAAARRRGAQGNVYVQFIVEQSGAITNPSVLRGIDRALDRAALAVIAGMPRWQPGREKNGMPVRTRQVLPIKFSLDNGFSLSGGDSEASLSGDVDANYSESYADSTLAEIERDDLLYYVFRSTKLGWINCDRFVDLKKRDKVTFIVEVPDIGDGDVDVKLIFERYRSIMPGMKVGRYYHFADVRKGETASVLALRSTGNGLEMASRKVTMSAVPDSVMHFESATVETVIKYLDKLSRK